MKRILVLFFACTLVLTGCNTSGAAGPAVPDSAGFAPNVSPAEGTSAGHSALSAGPETTLEPETVKKDYAALYLEVLEDLWAEDPGLNGGTYISVDLHDAPGDLTEAEIASIAERFAKAHGATPLTLSYRELIDQGYLTQVEEVEYQWDDGVLYSIYGTTIGPREPLPEDHFTVEKWVSPLGAYFFEDCTPHWAEDGTFLSYEIGGFAVS